MRTPAARKGFGVLGHVGNQNLGDEAIIAAVIQNIRRRHPDAAIYGFTKNPEDTRRRHAITSFPIHRPSPAPAPGRPEVPAQSGLAAGIRAVLRKVPLAYTLARGGRDVARAFAHLPAELRFMRACYRALRDVGLLIVAGSAQLNDYWEGPWGHPFTLFKWSVMARGAGARVAFLSMGALPLTTRLGRFFVGRALALASYRSYRDESSRAYIAQLGLNGAAPVVPDLAFSLDLDAPASEARSTAAVPVVGINPMPWFRSGGYWPETDASLYDHYVRTLAAFGDWLIERQYRVSLFPTQLLVDPGAARDVRRLMRRAEVLEPRIGSLEDLVSTIAGFDFVVATRYHAALISLLLHKPVLAIAYEPKATHLMTEVGRSELALAIKDLRLESLIERFRMLEAKRQAWGHKMRARLSVLRRALAAQYDRVFALPEEGR